MRSTTVQALISELEAEEVESFTDTALGDDLTDLRRAMDRIEFQFSRRLDLFARRQGYVAFGFVSLISWLRRPCRLSPGAASQPAEVARNLPSLPDTSTALSPGQIGFPHAPVPPPPATEAGPGPTGRHGAQPRGARRTLAPKP